MELDRPIRVMQIIARMNVGGPAVLVAELMRGIDKARFDEVLITGFCAQDEADYLDEVATDLRAMRVKGLGRSISIFSDIKSFFILLRLIRQFNPDIIHTHTAKAGVLGRVAGLIALPRAKRIHTFHGHLLHGYFGSFKTRLVVITERLLARNTLSLVAIGNQVKEDLLEAKIGKANQYSVIFPGVRKLESLSKVNARAILGLTQGSTYLVFVGRLTQIKRPDRLIDIARYLKITHPTVEILIAGAGEKLEELQGVTDRENLPIKFLGWRNDIGRILSAGDIAILCSDNEGIPLTLIQASQYGLPIISTNVGSVSDIVVEGETGLLTETNTQSLIKALDNLLTSPVKMNQLGQAGKIKAESLFSLEGMVYAHEKLYSQAIEKVN
jgi:glycosyltransferase involved in cell wall biosynthesis